MPSWTLRHFLQLRHACGVPQIALKQRVIDLLRVAASDAEADMFGDILQDRRRLVLDVVKARVEAHRHVAAGNVKADTADRDVIRVADHAADRMRIAKMPVGAEHARGRAARRKAGVHLRQRARVMFAIDFLVNHLGHSFFCNFNVVMICLSADDLRCRSERRGQKGSGN